MSQIDCMADDILCLKNTFGHRIKPHDGNYYIIYTEFYPSVMGCSISYASCKKEAANRLFAMICVASENQPWQ